MLSQENRHERQDLLLVDDNVELCGLLGEVLESHGYHVTCAANGAQALQCLRDAPPPDLILLDLVMPVKDGWQFRMEQRADPQIAAIPVLAMSGQSPASAAALDAVGFLTKPVRPAELLDRLRSLLGPSPSMKGYPLTIQNGWGADEEITERMTAPPVAGEIPLVTRIVGDVVVGGRAYRITEATTDLYEVVRLDDGLPAGSFSGSSGSMWQLCADGKDEEFLRTIIRAAIDEGVLLATPTD